MSIEEKIKQQIKENNILIYMKGSPYEPKCGFSARTVQALIDCGAEFSYVDILENQDVRESLPSISDWPTFPQVFVSGELIGGCDIVSEMHEAGELLVGLDGHPSLKVAKIEETHRHSIKDILEEGLEHELHALSLYKKLLVSVVDASVYLEEYARSMIGEEEQHSLELKAMLKDFG